MLADDVGSAKQWNIDASYNKLELSFGNFSTFDTIVKDKFSVIGEINNSFNYRNIAQSFTRGLPPRFSWDGEL